MEEFNKLDTPATATDPAVDAGKPGRKAKNAELVGKLNAAMQETLATDPTYAQRANRLRNAIEVVNTLGFSNNGTVVLDQSAKDSPDGKRKLSPEGQIVGYIIKNVGDEAIPVTTEKYTKDDATGRWVANQVEVTLQPGATMALARKWMTVLATQPEFSMQFANGTMAHSSTKFDESDLTALLESYYFSFNDPAMKVHDPAVKVQIGEKTMGDTGETWVVKAQYAEDFGFLNNKPEKAAKKTRAAGPDSKQKVANYLQTLIRNGGVQ